MLEIYVHWKVSVGCLWNRNDNVDGDEVRLTETES